MSREYVAQRLGEIGVAPAKPAQQKRTPQVVDPTAHIDRQCTKYIRRVRQRSPDRSTWFDVSKAFIEGYHCGQGEMLRTLRISGPTSALVTILRRQAAGLEADQLTTSAALMRQAADALEQEYFSAQRKLVEPPPPDT